MIGNATTDGARAGIQAENAIIHNVLDPLLEFSYS